MPVAEQYWTDPEKYRAATSQWQKENRDKIKANRETRREVIRVQQRAWYERNKVDVQDRRANARTEEDRRKKAEYDRGRDPEENRKRTKDWARRNPDKVLAQGALKRARRRKATIGDRAEIGAYISILYHDPCSYCGGPMEAVDHIEPLSTGGNHSSDNLTASCGSCNSSKYNKSLLLYLLDARKEANV